MRKNLLFFLVVLVFLFYSCSSSNKINPENYIYFRDGSDTVLSSQKSTIIQNGDLLNIKVYSSTTNQEQAAIFNIPSVDKTTPPGYQVSEAGNIDMPVIGAVKVSGLSRNQLQDLLVKKLSNYVKNPSVTVNFLDFSVNVLGEVHKPGLQKFNIDRVTIIDAIGSAGDLTDYGERTNITVIREESGKKIYHTIDLTSRNIFLSPAYILQPNDIVYVKPNANKLKEIGTDPSAQRKTGIILSVVGIIVSIASVVIFALSYKN